MLGGAFDSGKFFYRESPQANVDSKDFRLLVALHENARQSYRSLGQRVSLSAPAVRNRLKRLQDCGILQGYWLYPDPAIFNRNDLMIFYKGDWKREDALKALSVDNVVFVAWKLDGGLSVQTWPVDPKRPVKDLTFTLGARPVAQTFTEAHSHSKVGPVNWRILDSLVDDPTLPLDDLVEKTGLSPKTVRKHLQSMIQTETIFIMPRLGSLADSGDLVYHLAVTGKAGFSELRQVLGEAFLISSTNRPPMKYLLCRADDLSDVMVKTQAARKLPGVDSVELTLNRELLVSRDFLHRQIREKIKRWECSRNSRFRGV